MAPSASAPPSSSPYDAELAIVGAGPVGLYAAYYAGFRDLSTIVLETLPLVGGQIATFYPNTEIYDVPGFPSVTGGELVARLYAQATTFAVDFRLGEEVTALARENGVLRLVTRPIAAPGSHPSDELSYRVGAVLVAAGIGSFSPQRIPDPAIAAFEGRGLRYFPPAPDEVRGKRVLVLGGSERAVDVAVTLADTAAAVTLVHRRDRLPVSETVRHRLDASPVHFLPFHELTALHGKDRVQAATLGDRRDGREQRLDVEHVVPCYGFHADSGTTGRFGARTEDGAILVDSRMASDQPGVWAAGDGATYPGKVRVLAADFGEACTAVNNIAAVLLPDANVFPGYSSHRKGAARRPR
ncbi:NAD(P)/FAD-dependent oxidoreductase [Candidatus Binatia bacterium]|nr:NAD(P)/FAD-dependent oxidoreductase [Candidatus Binatia bacterium]